MTEKSELPSDQVSLPPTYAPSETFTDSPPPAYRRNGMVAVRVARIVCFTMLAITFIIGFFVVTHKWVQTKECKCPMDESRSVQHAALFAQPPNIPNSDLDNNKIEELIQKQEAETKVVPGVEPLVKEEEFVPEEQDIEEDEEEITEDVQEDEQLTKDIKLPKDLLLGNPQMAGRNVYCKVEKRQRKIADGIMTQAIIVTCDDEDEDDIGESDEEFNDERLPLPVVPIRPPLSLLSTIMKVLSARPRSMVNRPSEEPRLIPFPIRPMQGPVQGPFHGPFQGPMQGPMHGPMQGPVRILRPIKGPFPGPFPGPLSPVFVPLRKIHVRRPISNMESEEYNSPIPFQEGPPPMMHEDRDPRMNGMMPPMRFLQRPEENNIRRLPFPLSTGPLPIRVIRLPQMEDEFNEEEQRPIIREEEQNEGPFPLPVHPLLKLFPARRIIRLRPKQSLDNFHNEPLPFPLPRGALPLRHLSDEPPMPHPMPEASGRALPSPVALPGVRVLRLPFRPQPQPFPEAKLITHMEVRQPPEEENQPQEPRNNLQPPNVLENQSFRQNNKEFGPPKIHTVIENAPRLPDFDDEEPQEEISPLEPFHHEPITQIQSQPRLVAPPPPGFAREGRTSFLAQLNPDAEVIHTTTNSRPEPTEPTIHRVVIN